MPAISDSRPALLLAFCLSAFALGIPYWLIPYEQLTLPNGLFGIGIPVLAIAAMVLRWKFHEAMREAILIPALAAPAVVLMRIIVEVFLIADSHNLWPFELVIAGMLGIIVAGSGGLAGNLLARTMQD
jgi:hypothetical protein